MHFKLFAATVAGLALLLPSTAIAAGQGGTCCEKAMACCDKPAHVHDASAVDMLLSLDPQFSPAPPVRQAAEVWFMRPTLIGRSIVQGRYVIEHDNDRAARGEPCTHVYAYNDRDNPVAAFHCAHIERERAGRNTVVLVTMADGMQKLTEFQFAGETAAHGHPSDR